MMHRFSDVGASGFGHQVEGFVCFYIYIYLQPQCGSCCSPVAAAAAACVVVFVVGVVVV